MPSLAVPPKRRQRPLHIVLSFLLAVLCPVWQIGASIHEAAVRHVVCADHGEMTHAAPSPGHRSSSHDSGPASRQAGVEGDQSGIGHEHEHCPFSGLLRRQASIPTLAASLTTLTFESPAFGEPTIYVAPGTRLLLNAPKTSPPRA